MAPAGGPWAEQVQPKRVPEPWLWRRAPQGCFLPRGPLTRTGRLQEGPAVSLRAETAQGVWLAAVHRLPALLCEGPVAWRPWAGTGERLQAILTQKAHGGTQNCI